MKSLLRISYLRRSRRKTGIVAEFEKVLSISGKPKKIKEEKYKIKNNNNKK